MDIDLKRYKIMIKINSIKTRILGYYFITIFITIFALGMVLWFATKDYYYKNIESTLKDQINLSGRFYSKYLNTSDPQKIYEDLVENFFYNIDAQVQIIDKESRVVWDDLGIMPGTILQCEDIDRAFEDNETTVWIGRLEQGYTKDKIMAVSSPLKIDSNIIGVIRVVASLELVDELLKKIALIIVIVGILVILVTTIISIIISNSITMPLKSVTEAAKNMAQGNFNIKAKKIYNDEVGSMADTLNYMCKEILKNEELKNDFISSITHELKTPLTSIKGWGMTLKIKEFTDVEQREKGLDIIIEESERLTSLVEELLDFSKFESSKMILNTEEFSLKDLLGDIIDQMKPRAIRNNINLSFEIKEDIPTILGDRNRLKQVFINIIDNGLKFTEEGGFVNITTNLQGEYVKIIVEDNGIGIKEKHISNIKKKFYKGESKRSGSGIGLAISDEILKLHGGSLDIESEYQKGTMITITLKSRGEEFIL